MQMTLSENSRPEDQRGMSGSKNVSWTDDNLVFEKPNKLDVCPYSYRDSIGLRAKCAIEVTFENPCWQVRLSLFVCSGDMAHACSDNGAVNCVSKI